MFTTLTTMFLFRHNRLVSGQMLNKCTLNLFTLLIILTTRQTFIYIYSYLHTYTRENSVLLQSQDERYMLWPSNSFLCCWPWKSLVFYCLFYIYNRNTSRIKDCSKNRIEDCQKNLCTTDLKILIKKNLSSKSEIVKFTEFPDGVYSNNNYIVKLYNVMAFINSSYKLQFLLYRL